MTRTNKYRVEESGYRIRTTADFNRVDLSKSQRKRFHRTQKLEKKADSRDIDCEDLE